jgi:hypothetical protein
MMVVASPIAVIPRNFSGIRCERDIRRNQVVSDLAFPNQKPQRNKSHEKQNHDIRRSHRVGCRNYVFPHIIERAINFSNRMERSVSL